MTVGPGAGCANADGAVYGLSLAAGWLRVSRMGSHTLGDRAPGWQAVANGAAAFVKAVERCRSRGGFCRRLRRRSDLVALELLTDNGRYRSCLGPEDALVM